MPATFFKKIPRVQYEFEIDGVVEKHDMVNTSIKYILSYQKSKKTSDIYKFAWLNDLRPDTFALRYYGKDGLFWLGLFSGGIYDIHNELPKTDEQLLNQLYLKYENDPAFTQYCLARNYIKDQESMYMFLDSTVHHYVDENGDIVDGLYYDQQGIPLQPQPNLPPNGTPVSILEYELDENEKKRYVNIIDTSFGPRFEAEYESAMNKLQSELEEDV